MTPSPDVPVPTFDLSREAVDLLAANARFAHGTDYPAGLRVTALNVAAHVENRGFTREEDEAQLRERIIGRARVFEAYLRGDGS